jgi:low temperature requirement protein LtrA
MAGTGLSGERAARAASLLRDRSGEQRVTNIELFFDLVYVFAVTQLSHYLLDHPTVRGALQAGLLLVMVWLVWASAPAHRFRRALSGRRPGLSLAGLRDRQEFR